VPQNLEIINDSGCKLQIILKEKAVFFKDTFNEIIPRPTCQCSEFTNDVF
jgi:hypothetical protein